VKKTETTAIPGIPNRREIRPSPEFHAPLRTDTFPGYWQANVFQSMRFSTRKAPVKHDEAKKVNKNPN